MMFDNQVKRGRIEDTASDAERPRIVGLKDATSGLSRPARLRQFLGSNFRLFKLLARLPA